MHTEHALAVSIIHHTRQEWGSNEPRTADCYNRWKTRKTFCETNFVVGTRSHAINNDQNALNGSAARFRGKLRPIMATKRGAVQKRFTASKPVGRSGIGIPKESKSAEGLVIDFPNEAALPRDFFTKVKLIFDLTTGSRSSIADASISRPWKPVFDAPTPKNVVLPCGKSVMSDTIGLSRFEMLFCGLFW